MSSVSTSYKYGKSMVRGMFQIFLFGLLVIKFQNANAQTLPRPDHIVILIEENENDSEVICQGCSAFAPWLNLLAQDSNSAVFNNMKAIQHPSQPNYLCLFSGSDQGDSDPFTGDDSITSWPLTTPNLARELLDKGLSFKTYSENLPYVGYQGVSSNLYERKHNPVTNWQGSGYNQVPDSLNQPYTAWPTDFNLLPTVSYVVPAEDSDMHSGNDSITAGDIWFHNNMVPYMQWALTHNSLFIVTWDESAINPYNQIPTIFYGPMVKGGRYDQSESHFSHLRTLEDMYGLPYAGASADSLPITFCWKTVTGINAVENSAGVKFFPNPASDLIQYNGEILREADTKILITDVTGRQQEEVLSNGLDGLSIKVSNWASGFYLYSIINADRIVQSGKFVVAH